MTLIDFDHWRGQRKLTIPAARPALSSKVQNGHFLLFKGGINAEINKKIARLEENNSLVPLPKFIGTNPANFLGAELMRLGGQIQFLGYLH